jgi:hypothetical protein
LPGIGWFGHISRTTQKIARRATNATGRILCLSVPVKLSDVPAQVFPSNRQPNYSGAAIQGKGKKHKANVGGPKRIYPVSNPAYQLTVLRPAGPGRVFKRIRTDGRVEAADRVRRFMHSVENVATPEQLLDVVRRAASSNSAVVRGGAATDRQPVIRQQADVRDRGDEGFRDVPRGWLAMDVDQLVLPPMTDWRDDLAGVVEYAIGLLPEAFHDARIVYALTASHGLEFDGLKRWTGNYTDTVRLRLWALLDRPIDAKTAEAWTAAMDPRLGLDVAICRTVQLNYTARPRCDDGSDPLAPFIARGLAVVGLRDGLDDRVVVPEGIEAEARWSRAEGRAAGCASHPSAAAAILAIGRPAQPGGRPEVRSHLHAAANHTARAEWNARRTPTAEAVAETVRRDVLARREVIEPTLTANGRKWSEVLAYLGDELDRYTEWLVARGPVLHGSDGGGGRKVVRRVEAASPPKSNVVVLSRDELLEKTRSEIAEFVRDDVIGFWAKHREAWARVWDPDPEDRSPVVVPLAPRKMLAVSTGANKTGAAIGGALDVVAADRATGGNKAAYIIGPHHKLTAELEARVTETAREKGRRANVLRWLGRLQPDPKQPGKKMCHRPADVEVVEGFGLPVDATLCAGCPLADACGYMRQLEAAPFADVVVGTHAALTQMPAALPDPAVCFVDEAGWSSMLPADSTVALGALRKRPGDKLPAEVRAARVELANVLEAEADGGIRADVLHALSKSLEAKGLAPADLAKREFAAADNLTKAVTGLSGAELEVALQEQLGDAAALKAARRMGSLWLAVGAAADLPPGARSGRLAVITTDRDNDVREIRVRWKAGLAKRWVDVPIMFLDATADHAVLEAVFENVTPSPRYVAFNEHVKIRQVVDRSLSHSAIAPPTDDELKDAKPRQIEAAATARRNARKVLAALIADALRRYNGAPVLAIAPLATERIWREGPLPSWLSVTHHGATVGLDAYGNVRALYDCGRTLPRAEAVERLAGAITGAEPALKGYKRTQAEIVGADGSAVVVDAWTHPDPLCEALRWQLCEAALVQNVGRGRGLHRTADRPLDIHLWTDIAVDELGPVDHALWQGPTTDEEMLARGVWLELPADAAKVHPNVVVSAAALKQARIRYDQRHLPIETIISKCRWSYRYRPATVGRSAVGRATFLNPTSEAEARAYLEAHLGTLAFIEAIPPPPELEPVDDDVAAPPRLPPALPRPRPENVIWWPDPGSRGDRWPVDLTFIFDANRPVVGARVEYRGALSGVGPPPS